MAIIVNGKKVAGVGLPGKDGAPGADGKDGAPGKSAYQAAVEKGYTGTEEEFNAALANIPAHIADKANPHAVTAAQVGAYTKEQSLQKATAALYGLENGAVPDDVLNVLSRFQGGLGNEYMWAKYENRWLVKKAGESYNVNISSGSYSCQYSTSASIDESGKVVLDNPTSMTLVKTNARNLTGKYFICSELMNSGNVYYCDKGTDGDYSYSGTLSYCAVWGEFDFSGFIEYLNAPTSDAYPVTGVSGGYYYISLGQLGGAAHIVTGSYVGTGKTGKNNPNQITLAAPFQVLCIYGMQRPDSFLSFDNSGTGTTCVIISSDAIPTEYTEGFGFHYSSNANDSYGKKSVDGRTFSWYYDYTPSDAASIQLNLSGVVYHYYAIVRR